MIQLEQPLTANEPIKIGTKFTIGSVKEAKTFWESIKSIFMEVDKPLKIFEVTKDCTKDDILIPYREVI